MSIASEAVKTPQQHVPNGVMDTFAQVRQILVRLPFGDMLCEHSTRCHHEDMPDEDVHEADVFALTRPIPTDRKSPIDRKLPARLRSLIPPANFGAVEAHRIYRSAFPAAENHDFLGSLRLKTILTLVHTEISPEYQHFMEEHNIQHFRLPIPPNKGQVNLVSCDMRKALDIVMDRSNHPLLIHCNKGKHRTGCVVGCFRKVQEKESQEVFNEYHAYAGSKARLLDEVFIEGFDINTVLWMARRYQWKPVEEEETSLPSSSVSTASFDSVSPTIGSIDPIL
ncbi:hypothetical protein K491DRAFT_287274 [Lophiostoma macrostomum CBS 122681]|uniref:diphosphoinositol-polyphosphate diphosphatase n=1 Tax=Lophiostoma macrostomum CBS 122681 TaxID=1314788 RepID=A0A6A6TTM7_9PLEO|nr:hypothetical protein K491DRAFT_287274 [Lophiostoma macrostomum CBS 122681]